jgi:excisionase family DNA binding protein
MAANSSATEQGRGDKWSVREVARFLGVSTKTVWRWNETKRIPQGKKLPGRTVRWDPEALRRWFEKQPAA